MQSPGATFQILILREGMGKAVHLTEFEKEKIVLLRRAGLKYKNIAAEVGRSIGAVGKALKAASAPKKPERRGKSKKLDDRTERRIVRAVVNGAGSAKKVRDTLQLTVGVRTVQRTIEKVPWLKFMKPRRRPMLKPRHVHARLQWAYEHNGMDDFWWANVLFSDEKKWNMDGPDGYKQWVDTRAKQPEPVRRHTGGGSVMVWGGFCGGKKTPLKFLDGRVTAPKYVSTLTTHLQPVFDSETQIFQHDNAPAHKARLTTGWLRDQDIPVLTWPAYSPDLNPIENVWGYMSHAVYANGRQFYSIDDLKNAVQREWDNLPTSYLEALVKSMKTRVKKLHEMKGKYTGY